MVGSPDQGRPSPTREPAVLRQVRVGACGEVETAGPSLPAVHLRDAHVDPLTRLRVSGVLRGVDPAHPFPSAPSGWSGSTGPGSAAGRRARAAARSGGTFGSGQSLVTSMSSVASSPALMPAACCSVSSTLIQRPECPSGSSTVWNSTPLIVPRTATCLREGRFLLAVCGNRNTVDVPNLRSAWRRSEWSLPQCA